MNDVEIYRRTPPKNAEARGLFNALVEMTDRLILVRTETREETIQEIQQAIEPIIQAAMIMNPPDYFVRCLDQIRNAIDNLPPESSIELVQPLTNTEKLVAGLVANHLTTKEIAMELSVSIRTIETHRLNIRRKLGLSRGVALEHFLQDFRF